ncbi:hypothetical protein [Pedobacter sp. UBA4863]|uniref:hypothetical protein n=1 Tax=Pedobacter sp. UBA4863 TaxID=1947060 RepID=UPI0025D13A37|nr:hypothetical protein [Pedobacter sp. UBA4863]
MEGSEFRNLKVILNRYAADPRLNVWHLGILMAIVQLMKTVEFNIPISVSRKKIMELSRIGNYVTYHKYLSQLSDFGYILYNPSYHPGLGSQIILTIETGK